MFIKCLDNDSIQKLFFFEIITVYFPSNTNNSKNFEDQLAQVKNKIKNLSNNGQVLISLIELCSRFKLEEALKVAKKLDLELSQEEIDEIGNNSSTPESALYEAINFKKIDVVSLVSVLFQKIMATAHEACSTLMKASPLKAYLLIEMSRWEDNVSNKHFNVHHVCIKQINDIQERLNDPYIYQNDEFNSWLETLALLKKILDMLYKFQKINLSMENSKIIFLGMPLDIIKNMADYLPIHDIVKINTLCLLSKKIFENVKDDIFKKRLMKDFPEQKIPTHISKNYFSFYKETFLDHKCFLSVRFILNRNTPEKVFEEDFHIWFSKNNFPNLLCKSPEEMRSRLMEQNARADQYFGYFLIKLPINVAQSLIDKGHYHQLFSKVSLFVSHFFQTGPVEAPSITEYKVSYDSLKNKFQNLNANNQTLTLKDRSKEEQPQTKCSLM